MTWRLLDALAGSLGIPACGEHRVRPQRWLISIALVTSLCACNDQGAEPSASPSGLDPGQYQASGGKVCAGEQPLADVSDGFGTDEPAQASPVFPQPQRAWICRYEAHGGKPGLDKHGRYVHWHLQGAPAEVPNSGLRSMQTLLDELHPWQRPASRTYCPDNLGPRWLIVTESGGDLTGVAVDDFGCNQVRLTDDPRQTEPGDSAQAGYPPGWYLASKDLMDWIASVSRQSHKSR